MTKENGDRFVTPKVRQKAVSELTENATNPRTIDSQRLEDLKASLRSDPQMLEARPVIATPEGIVIAGNMRLRAAMDLGWETIPTITVDLDPERARMWMLRDNQQYGSWVEAEVAAMFEELAQVGVDLSLTGFQPAEIDRLLEAAAAPELIDPDEIPKVEKPITEHGDMWVLGNHVIACGDATKSQSLDRAMEVVGGRDAEAALVWTDPPYGVDYEGKTSQALTIENDDLSGVAHEDFLHEAFAAALAKCQPGAVWYVCAPSSPPQVSAFLSALDRLSIWQQTLVWVKDSFVLGRSDFHYRHELLLYGWAAGDHRSPPERCHDTVWEAPRPQANRDHPTAKPVELIERALKLSSRPGDLVLDPFLGSGSTVIAAEKTKRRCVGVEIDPHYVDVAVARLEKFTNKAATRIARGT